MIGEDSILGLKVAEKSISSVAIWLTGTKLPQELGAITRQCSLAMRLLRASSFSSSVKALNSEKSIIVPINRFSSPRLLNATYPGLLVGILSGDYTWSGSCPGPGPRSALFGGTQTFGSGSFANTRRRPGRNTP